MPTVSDMLAKEQRKGAVEGLKNSVVREYALIAHSGAEPEAEQELGRHRRDQLTFERNTGIDSNNDNNNDNTDDNNNNNTMNISHNNNSSNDNNKINKGGGEKESYQE